MEWEIVENSPPDPYVDAMLEYLAGMSALADRWEAWW